MDYGNLDASPLQNAPSSRMDIETSTSGDLGLGGCFLQGTSDRFPSHIQSAKTTFELSLPQDPNANGQKYEATGDANHFTLEPASPISSNSPDSGPALAPSYFSPDQIPRNALLDLYKQGDTPDEGLRIVGNHMGEFMAAIQGELRIPSMFIVPAGARSRGRATQLGNHWVLEVPLRVRNGLAVSPFPSLVPTPTPRHRSTLPHESAPIPLHDDLDDTISSASSSASAPLARSYATVQSYTSVQQEELPSPPTIPSKAESDPIPKKWTCDACRYRNPNQRHSCRGCGAQRDGGRRRFVRKPSRLGMRSPEDSDELIANVEIEVPPDADIPVNTVVAATPSLDPDLVIYEDHIDVKGEDPMAGRRRRRLNEESSKRGEPISLKKTTEMEIKLAHEELAVRRLPENLDPKAVERYLNSIGWPERKRVVHAHLLAIISERIREIPTWQEIPRKLFQHHLRLIGWPAGSPFPGPATTVTIYKRDALHNLCNAIWSQTLKIEAWGEEEKDVDLPPVVIDTNGIEYKYGAELRGKFIPAPPSPPTSDSKQIEDFVPSVLQPPVATTDGGSSEDPELVDDDETEDEGKDEDYTPSGRKATRRPTSNHSSPFQSAAKVRHIPTPSLRSVTERRYFRDAEIAQGKQDVEERTSDFSNSESFMHTVEWNLLRRMCRLHLSVYLSDNLGYTDFQDIPIRLREKRLRLTGWPVECDLPSGTHPANWKRDWVRTLLLAIWGKTLVLEDWGKDEKPEDAPLIVDTMAKKHFYNEAADALLSERRGPRIVPTERPNVPKPRRWMPGKHYVWEPIEPSPQPEEDARSPSDPSSSSYGPTTRRQATGRQSNSPVAELGARSPAVRFASSPTPGTFTAGDGSTTLGRRTQETSFSRPKKRMEDFFRPKSEMPPNKRFKMN